MIFNQPDNSHLIDFLIQKEMKKILNQQAVFKAIALNCLARPPNKKIWCR